MLQMIYHVMREQERMEMNVIHHVSLVVVLQEMIPIVMMECFAMD